MTSVFVLALVLAQVAAQAPVRASAVAPASAPAPAPESAPAKAPERALLLDVVAAGVDGAAAKAATAAVALAMSRRRDVIAVTEAELQSVADTARAREVLECTAGAECLAELSRWAAARFVISGTLGRLGATTTLTLSLADASTASVTAREAVVVEGPAQLPAAARELVGRLFGDAALAPRFALAAGEHASFAVFPLEVYGIDKAIARSLTDILAVEVKRIDGTTVVSIDDVAAMVSAEQQKSVLVCSNDAACLAEIGAALDVDRLVVSSVGKVADTFVVSMRLLDVKQVTVLSRVTESFVGPDEQLIRAVRRSARELLGVAPGEAGSLVVATPEIGAHVFVDGEERGRTPTAPITQLAPGRHTLRVAQEGFFDWQGDVYVDTAETTAQWAPLVEKPRLVRPFVPPWVFYGLAGASAAVLGSAGVTGGLMAWSQGDYDATALASTRAAVSGERELMPRFQRTESLALATDVLLVVGASSAALALASIPLVRFDD